MPTTARSTRRLARDELEPRGLTDGGGYEEQLRAILKEMGILDDDIEKVCAKLKGASAEEDDAPATGGSEATAQTPAEDRRGRQAHDAAIMATRRKQVAAGLRPETCLREPISRVPDASAFHSRFPEAARIRHL